MAECYLVGIDVGTQGSKGVLVSPDGQVLAQHFCEHEVLHPRPDWAEHDAERHWWQDLVHISRALLAQSAVSPHKIGAVCVSGLIPDLLPTDGQGHPLRHAILYSDNRAVKEIDEVNARLGCALTSEEITPKLLWFMRNEPDLFARTRMVFNAHSYLVYRLTGEYTIDYLTASLFGAIYDAAQARWREDICAELGIPMALLPPALPPAEIAGKVTREAAQCTGLAEDTPVLVGSGDVYFSLLGAGVLNQGDVMIYYGTAGLTTLCLAGLQEVAESPYQGASGFPFQYPAYMLTSGELVRWFRDQFAPFEVAEAACTGVTAYSLLDRMAEQVPPGAQGLLCLPYFLGQRSPEFDPYARGVFFGWSMAHTRAHMYRAILESYGYGILHGLESTLPGWQHLIRRVVATGGGAVSPVWKQIVSDIVGIAQEYVAGADSPLGDAFLAGYALGLFKDFSTIRDRWLRVTDITVPDMARHVQYQPYYEIYRDLHRDLKERFRAVAGLG
nr:hypothetical protein [Chloroflexota bacterium]